MTPPTVSVLMTAYNHEAFVERALDSVRAQDFTDLELLVADDCSSDGTAAVIRRWCDEHAPTAVVELKDVNGGVCGTLNSLLARARGRLVVVVDGDDWCEPWFLSRLVSALDSADEDVAVAYADARVVAADGALLRPSFLADSLWGERPPQGDVFARLQEFNFLFSGATMVRRSALDAVGGYDGSLAFEDWDLWLRLADRYRFVHVDEVVANRRVLPTSMEHSQFGTRDMQDSVARLHQKWLSRDEQAQHTSAWWMRRAATVLAPLDQERSREILGQVRGAPSDDHVPWRLLEASLAIPGSGRAWPGVRSATLELQTRARAEAGAWRNGRRLPHGVAFGRRQVGDSP